MKGNLSAPPFRGRFLLVIAWFLLCVHEAVPLVIDEYQLKAAFVFNFLKFVEWPAVSPQGNGNEFAFCIVGHSPMDAELNGLAGKTVQGRQILVRTIQTSEVQQCKAVFIPGSEKEHLSMVVRDAQQQGTLTIGDSKGFAEKGIIINMYMQDGRVRFEVNTEAAARAGLKIDSRLLGLAKIVSGVH